MLKYKIKIIFDFDEDEFVVFASGLEGLEGRGETEESAINDFREKYERLINEHR